MVGNGDHFAFAKILCQDHPSASSFSAYEFPIVHHTLILGFFILVETFMSGSCGNSLVCKEQLNDLYLSG